MHHHLLQIIKSIILNFFFNLASAPTVFQQIVILHEWYYEKTRIFGVLYKILRKTITTFWK
jgi:hypothetical protein